MTAAASPNPKPKRIASLPPLPPADPVGKRFCEIFHHGWDYIKSTAPQPGEKIQWRTESDYLLEPRVLWRLYNDPTTLLGVRFNSTTRYALIDIDRNSQYHPLNNSSNYQLVLKILEDMGFCRVVPIISSDSNGLHLYLFLPVEVPTFNLACGIKHALIDGGCQLKPGQLEILPNTKAWRKGIPSLYQAHRLPLQTGSYLVDICESELAPLILRNQGIPGIKHFLDLADTAAAKQDMEKIEAASAYGRQQQGVIWMPEMSINAAEWKRDLEIIIEEGFSGPGQTNTLLLKIATYGKVFQELDGTGLIEYVYKTVIGLPGYPEYCNHQHEIYSRAAERVRCIEEALYYSQYPSFPPRSRRFREIFLECTSQIVTESANSRRAAAAIERIKETVAYLEDIGSLPVVATARAKAIVEATYQRTNIKPSFSTLHSKKYLPFWHPHHYKLPVIDQPEGISADSTEQILITDTQPQTPEPALIQDFNENYTPAPILSVCAAELASETDQGNQGTNLNPEAEDFKSYHPEKESDLPNLKSEADPKPELDLKSDSNFHQDLDQNSNSHSGNISLSNRTENSGTVESDHKFSFSIEETSLPDNPKSDPTPEYGPDGPNSNPDEWTDSPAQPQSDPNNNSPRSDGESATKAPKSHSIAPAVEQKLPAHPEPETATPSVVKVQPQVKPAPVLQAKISSVDAVKSVGALVKALVSYMDFRRSVLGTVLEYDAAENCCLVQFPDRKEWFYVEQLQLVQPARVVDGG